jgi:phosphoenolpyruvate carboxykinase (ATP)
MIYLIIRGFGHSLSLSGAKTGRSPKDKRVVKGDWTAQDVWWGKGSPNIPMDVDTFIRTRERALDYLNMLDEVFVFDGFAGADPESRIAVRVLCGRAYHALFMHNMLIRPTPQELKVFVPDMTIINAGMFPCNRYATDMTSSTCVAMNLKHRELVILGTQVCVCVCVRVCTCMCVCACVCAFVFPCNCYATDMTSSTCVAINLKHHKLVILYTQVCV